MPSSKSIRTLGGLAPMIGLVALSACGPQANTFPPACPSTGILRDGADLTRFRGTDTDLTDMVVDGRITGLSGKCKLDDPTHLRTSISVGMSLTRGPANTSRTANVTYFVAAAKGDTILDKQIFTLPVTFPSNMDQMRIAGDPVDLVLPVSGTVTGAAYRIVIGFQLTPQELAFNRRRGVR
jgi:hypothetical protein